jgi:tRNA-splicing ligase RtcB
MGKYKLRRITEVLWEMPRQGGMKVPARILASQKLLADMERDLCLKQAQDMASLDGVVDHVVVLSDAHQGYGFPIGGVAAFRWNGGIVSPGGVGYDINCGVRLVATDIPVEDFMSKRGDVLHEMTRCIPSGVGRGGKSYTGKQVRDVLVRGSEWAVANGLGDSDDLDRTEERGRMGGADPAGVSDRAVKRGLPQLGTLGAGNHFLEVQRLDRVFDEAAATAFGLLPGKVAVMIHCGSRGLGHQVASDYIRQMESVFGFEHLPGRELINAPIDSEMGRRYLAAMNCAVNFAFCNRQMMMHRVREILARFFPASTARLVYDVCHNIAKKEEHIVKGEPMTLCVHRKGATRSFGPGRPEVPEVYREIGQPVLIPGSMGTASYVLVGTRASEELTFGSTAHGAGRVESRTAARKKLRGEQVRRELAERGIEVRGSWKGLAEEAPQVYKDIDEVVRVSHEAGVGSLVARMCPLCVMKG